MRRSDGRDHHRQPSEGATLKAAARMAASPSGWLACLASHSGVRVCAICGIRDGWRRDSPSVEPAPASSCDGDGPSAPGVCVPRRSCVHFGWWSSVLEVCVLALSLRGWNFDQRAPNRPRAPREAGRHRRPEAAEPRGETEGGTPNGCGWRLSGLVVSSCPSQSGRFARWQLVLPD